MNEKHEHDRNKIDVAVVHTVYVVRVFSILRGSALVLRPNHSSSGGK